MPTTDTPIYNQTMDAALAAADDEGVEFLADLDQRTGETR